MKITNKTLSAWIDQGLSPKKMKAVSRAVDANAELQARVAALRAVGAALREDSVEMSVPAEKMAADVRRSIRRQEAPRLAQHPRWVWAVAAACVVGAAVLIPLVLNQPSAVALAKIESVDSELPGASTMVYTDHDAGWTVVWLDGVELEPGS